VLTITRDTAVRRSTSELYLPLKAHFNKLAEDGLDAQERRRCLGSIEMVKAELVRRGRF
jgi:hypothetical protein